MFTKYISTGEMLQHWINEYNSRVHEEAVKYIKENANILNTNINEFMKNCPPSCELKVKEMLLKAGIEFPDTSLKKYDKILSDYVKTYTIDYQNFFDDYVAYTLDNKSTWTVIDTNSVLEETP